MAKAIGPSFASELQAAGLLGLPFTWTVADGTFNFVAAMTQPQKDAVLVVYAAHDPLAPIPPKSADVLAAEAAAALNGGQLACDVTKLLKAKVISDLAARLGKAPATLTPAELAAERNRIATIYAAI